MSKKRIPYFSFYPTDFMNGVRGLSPQEIGVYTMILCRIYEENGAIELHHVRMAAYCGMREPSFRKVMDRLVELGKFQVENGMVSNRRAEAEIRKRSDDLKISSTAGKASARKRQHNQRGEGASVDLPFNHADTDTDATPGSVADAPPVVIGTGDADGRGWREHDVRQPDVHDRRVEFETFQVANGIGSDRRAADEHHATCNDLKLGFTPVKKGTEKMQQNQSSVSTAVDLPFNHTDTDTDKETTLGSVVKKGATPRGEPVCDLEGLTGRLIGAVGENGIQPHAAIVVGPIVELIASGVSLELDILPVLRARAAHRTRPVGSWSYFVNPIREAYERRISAGKSLLPPVELRTGDADWLRRLHFARQGAVWSSAEFGPMPGTPGCRVPGHLIEDGDGRGWRDHDFRQPMRSAA